jgi:hypothetical protein
MKNSKVTRTVGLWIMMLGVLLIMFTGIGFRPDAYTLDAGTSEIGAASQQFLSPWIGAITFVLGSFLVYIGYQPGLIPFRVKK